MPIQNYDALLRALKQGVLAPVYYLFGAEEVLKEEAARAILDAALDPGMRDFNFDVRSAGHLDPETFHSLVNTLPMMAERRVVFVREVEAWKKKPAARAELLKYLARPSPDTVLVLLQGADDTKDRERARGEEEDGEIARHGFAVRFDPLPPERVVRWLGYRARQIEVTFDAGAAEHLAAVTGHDLTVLSAELQKLAALAGEGPVTLDRIADLVGVRHGETMYDWRDAVLGDDTARAIRLLAPVLAQVGNSGVRLVSTLGTSLAGVGIARAHYDRQLRGGSLERAVFDTIRRARPFGLPDWKAEAARWSRWAAGWPVGRLRTALRASLEADRSLKSTRISDDRGVLTDLILQLSPGSLAAA